jgi:hypothetical protein
MENKLNGYMLTELWFNFSFENTEKVTGNHGNMWQYIVFLNNKLNWVENFGLPRQYVMGIIGIKNHKTYSKVLNDLVEWGFVEVIQESKNQYSSTIISIKNSYAMVKNTTALYKQVLQHLPEHLPQHCIDKELLNVLTNKRINDENAGLSSNLNTKLSSSDLPTLWEELKSSYPKKENILKAKHAFGNLDENTKLKIVQVVTKTLVPLFNSIKADTEFYNDRIYYLPGLINYIQNERFTEDQSQFTKRIKKSTEPAQDTVYQNINVKQDFNSRVDIKSLIP